MPFDPVRLKKIRRKRKIGLRKLGKLLGINHQQIQKYEAGTVKPGADRLEQLANALDTNMDFLMGRSTYEGKRTPEHDAVDAAFNRHDIDMLIALVGEQVRKQNPPEKRVSGSSPRTKKKLTLRR
jgi:transcriptional regulator with XRE-family HTH domain